MEKIPEPMRRIGYDYGDILRSGNAFRGGFGFFIWYTSG